MPRLSKALIVDAARDVLDEGGIDAVTVRNVANRLQVKAPALYWHVKNKQELLDEMGTEIQRRVVARMAPAPWPQALADYARALRAEYLAHRDGARTFSGTRLTDPQVLRNQEPLLQAAVDQGLALADVVLATELLTCFVVGFVIEEQERSQSEAQRYSLPDRTAALGDDVPLTIEAGGLLYADPGVRFETHLSRLLAAVA